VRPGDGAHAVSGGLIVEENTAASIDLEIDETRCEEDAGRQPCLRPTGGKLTPRGKPDDTTVPNQDRGFGMPSVAVKHFVRQDDVPTGD
jgi:hypothetical protein